MKSESKYASKIRLGILKENPSEVIDEVIDLPQHYVIADNDTPRSYKLKFDQRLQDLKRIAAVNKILIVPNKQSVFTPEIAIYHGPIRVS